MTTTQTIEAQVAAQIAHREHVAKVLARTGGEVVHPQFYDLREAIRCAVIEAIDNVSADMDAPKFSDAELPALFKALDPIAERIFMQRMGLYPTPTSPER